MKVHLVFLGFVSTNLVSAYSMTLINHTGYQYYSLYSLKDMAELIGFDCSFTAAVSIVGFMYIIFSDD
jgi:hypothetical protein